MLQPCNPTFIQARDNIIRADAEYYQSKYKCDIWRAFAKRGLGVNAKSSPILGANYRFFDGKEVPPTCR